MTPGARLAAAIEVLTEMFARSAAADRALSAWGRAHRFAGSKDRAAIGERVYLVLRRLNECAYRLGGDRSPRALVLSSLAIADALNVDAIEVLCTDGAHALGALTESERAALQNSPPPAADPWTRLNYPQWLHDELVTALGARLEDEMAALNLRAPLDLRVNGLKANRDDVLADLRGDAIEATPCRFASLGLRIAAGADAKIANLDVYLSGRVEIQDEASQLAVTLAGARAGETVIDLAAGAGGKSLGLAAAMTDRGRIIACDIDPMRLATLAERAARAGVTIIEGGGDPYTFPDLARGADLVFVDAPCSSSGTWRRNPEAKWTLTPERLASYRAAQAQLLDRAAQLCSPRGRIVYATCSLLPSEGPCQVALFLQRHPKWTVRPATAAWHATLSTTAPMGIGQFALLTPAQDETDGFFVAVLTGV